jgi:type I restriction enzyme S subunit
MEKSFDDVFEDKTKYGTKIKTDEYHKEGKYLIIDQGQEQIAGYTDIEEGVFTDVPVVIFGDHTRTIKYVDKPFFLGADGVKVLRSKLEDANYKYLYYALKNAKIPNTGYNRHFKWLKEVNIKYPDSTRQADIVAILDKVTEIIKGRQKELAKLDDLIKARFVEMFGNVGKDEKGWGLTCLCECCEINPKKNDDIRLLPGLKVSFVPMQAVSDDGKIDTSQVKIYDEVKNGFTYFAENDVLFAKITPCMENGKGAVAAELYNGIGFGSTEFHVLRPRNEVCNAYWLYVLTTFKSFRKNAEMNMTGSSGQKRVPSAFLENYKIAIPPLELQNQFADFVAEVNKSKFTQLL